MIETHPQRRFTVFTAFTLFVVFLTGFASPFNAVAWNTADELGCPAIDFQRAPEYATGNGPRGVAVADLDADGRGDIVAAYSFQTNGISILRSLANGGFARQDISLGAFDVPHLVFLHDIDSDSRPEIVLTYSFNPKISIFRNLTTTPGNIVFGPQTDFAVMGGEARQVAFGDIDSDGLSDLVVAVKNTPPGISIFRSTSTGPGVISFAPRVDISIGAPAWVVTLADLDADGKLDIASGGNETSRDVRVLRNTSTAAGEVSFAAPVNFSTNSALGNITAADLDGDGKLDLAYPRILSNQFGILRNTSSGAGNIAFASQQSFLTGMAPYWLIAEDLTGDGKPDVATVNSNSNSVSVLINTGSAGSLSFAPRNADHGGGIRTYHFAMGDVDADGKKDLVTANLDGNTVSVMTNITAAGGPPDFVSRKDYLTQLSKGARSVTAGDFNNDGLNDVAAAVDITPAQGGFSIYLNNGQYEFGQRVDYASGVASAKWLAAADFDSDGRDDIAVAHSPGLGILRNIGSSPGSPSFQLIPVPVTDPVKRVEIVDIDSDGKQDLIIIYGLTTDAAETTAVLRNTSTGPGSIAFSTYGSVNYTGRAVAVSSADLDLDSLPDLVLGISPVSNSYLKILRNNGISGFTQQDIFETGEAITGPAVGDFDGDGKPDIAAAIRMDLAIYRNSSQPGTITMDTRQLLTGRLPERMSSADIDGDGRPDLVNLPRNGSGAFFSVMKNLSTGAGNFEFETAVRFAYGGNWNGSANTSTMQLSDVDENGKPDILTGFSATDYGTVSVHLNQSCGSVAPSANAPFDFDGDGKTDVSIFRPTPGEWWYLKSSDGGNAAATFGASTDTIVPADYTGDGKTDMAFFRPGTGSWFILRSNDFTFYAFPFGSSTDVTVPGDYDGDNKADAAVFRPSNSTWYISRSSDNGTTITTFGTAGDKPVPADYDGDGKTDTAIYRPSLGQWWLNRSTDGVIAATFGAAADQTVQGDYTGDGKADMAYFRPSTNEWYILRSNNFTFYSFVYGAAGDVASPGDYDGDGKIDATVFRPSSNTWYSFRSSTSGTVITPFGAAGDRSVPNAYVR